MSNNGIVPGFDEEMAEGYELRMRKIPGMNDGLIVEIGGHFLNEWNCHGLERGILRTIDRGFRRIAVSLQISHVSVTAISVFAVVQKQLRTMTGELAFFDTPPGIVQVYSMLGFDSLFQFFDDEASAITYLALTKNLATAFPKHFPCPICNMRCDVEEAGSFRCIGCKTMLTIDQSGQVFLG